MRIAIGRESNSQRKYNTYQGRTQGPDPGPTLLHEAINEFLVAKRVEGLSPNTIRNYSLSLKRLRIYLGDDVVVSQVRATKLRRFLDELRTNPQPAHNPVSRTPDQLSAKTIKNIHSNLSAFFHWANAEEIADENPMDRINSPQPKPPVIEPYSREDVLALLDVAKESKSEELRLRDTAIILFLLDTGVRNSELRNLKMRNTNLQSGKVRVKGKGRLDHGTGKERFVIFSPKTSDALQDYFSYRGEVGSEDYLFVTSDGKQLSRYHLTQHIRRLGERAGLRTSNPHRFRHTFAIQFLRNDGGNIYALQQLLGHSSLDMVKRYLAIAQSDLEQAHRLASPVTQWDL